MDEVTPRLYVGTDDDADDAATLRDGGITTVVSLTHRSPERTVADVTVVERPMLDGPQNGRGAFAEAVSAARTALEGGETVLVHCSAGASRSPAVAAATLALHEDRSLEDAFEQVAARRPAADPHPAMIRQAVHVLDDLG
jgi:atypical dual specificity phosphatase